MPEIEKTSEATQVTAPKVIKAIKPTTTNFTPKADQDIIIESLDKESSDPANCKAVEIEFNTRGKLKKYRIMPNPSNPLKKLQLHEHNITGMVKIREYDPAAEAALHAAVPVDRVIKILYCGGCGYIVGMGDIPSDEFGKKMLASLEAKGFRAGSKLVNCPECAKTLVFEELAISLPPAVQVNRYEDLEPYIRS